METQSQSNPYLQHYLEIRALDPVVAQEPTQPKEEMSGGFFLTMPIVVILLIFIGGFALIFLQRLRSLQSSFFLAGLAIMPGALIVGVGSIEQQSRLRTKAVTEITPMQVVVSDVSDKGFSVSWRTMRSTAGSVKISRTADMKDQLLVMQDVSPREVHYLIVTDLEPATSYYVQILSETLWFQQVNQPIEIITLGN